MKNEKEEIKTINTYLDERKLSILTNAFFSSWMLSFLFEGQIFHSLANHYAYNSTSMTLSGGAMMLLGLILSGLFIKTKKIAKLLFLFSYMFFIVISIAFFFPPSILWIFGIIISSLLAGACTASWAIYLKSSTPKNDRIKTIADMLILSNIFMILLNTTAIHISQYIGLALSMVMLLCAFILALKLPVEDDNSLATSIDKKFDHGSIRKQLAFLYLFITIITINSGLMYYVINPAFSHLLWLTSWYWAIPYVVAIIIIRNLPKKINKEYILYIAIAMIGLSFIGFMILGSSVLSYLVVNTMMLGAFGIYDLFWWGILGEMLDYHKNPVLILGVGLSANILGVILGGTIGNIITTITSDILNPVLLALTVVCITLILLPPLYKNLSYLLGEQASIKSFSESREEEKSDKITKSIKFEILSEREKQVTNLLLQGKTYKTIGNELFISENTVKYYVKNIYSKLYINSRAELIDIMSNNETTNNI